MNRAERLKARQARRTFFLDLVTLLRSARAAVQRDPGLGVELIAALSFELGVARERYGGGNAVIEWLRRATLRTAHALIHSFEEPTDTTRIALAIFRAGLGERRPPKRAPLRLVDAKAAVS